MKSLIPLILVALCGCQTPAPVATLPAAQSAGPRPSLPEAAPSAPVAVPSRAVVADAKSRRQAQLIEALIDQNEALTAQLAARQKNPAPSVSASVLAPIASPPTSATPATGAPPPEPTPAAIAPNAEGIIDLAAIEQPTSANEPINPFAVRSAETGKTREVTLLVGGIILGRTPCAVLNDRLVQPGDIVEGLEVDHIEIGSVVARHGAYRLRLPVSPNPVRVKLPL